MLTAIDDVQLVHPDTVIGKSLQVVGYLPAGKSLPVSECRSRKSDIDVIVLFDEKPVVAWKGTYKFTRRTVELEKDSQSVSTRSCSGLLIGL
jgi:hypothetical protein